MRKDTLKIARHLMWLGAMSLLIILKQKDHPRMVIQELLATNVSGQEPTGPDKANLRDFFMTVDLEEKRVPKERLVQAKHEMEQARVESRNFGWEQVQTEIAGRTRSFLLDSETGELLSGAVTGGLWKNSNYRQNAPWELVEDTEQLSISCLASDPANQSIVYMGTGESFTAILNYRESSSAGNGIWKSTDSGNSWVNLSSTAGFAYINDIVVRLEDGQSVIYAAVGSGEYKARIFTSEPGDGLYRSSDGGVTWDQVLSTNRLTADYYMVSDIELTSSNRLIAGTMRNLERAGGGLVFYSDNGIDWEVNADFLTTVNEFTDLYGFSWFPGRVVIDSSPGNPDHIYAIFMAGYENVFMQTRDYTTFLKQSLDGGVTWSDIELPNGWSNIPWHAASIAVDPTNENKIVIGALDLYSLEDASDGFVTDLSWNKLTNWDGIYAYYLQQDLTSSERDSLINMYVHADIHKIEFIDASSDEVLIATDGGIFYTDQMSLTGTITGDFNDNYPAFTGINQNLTTTQYYTVALDPRKGSRNFIGGTQDNGTLYNTTNFVDHKSFISGGDGAFCFYDQDNPELFITSVYSNYFFIFENGSQVAAVPLTSGLFINPCDYDSRSNLLYANMMAGPEGGLYTSLFNRFADTLLILNVNSFTGNNTFDFGDFIVQPLNSGISDPITAVKVSPFGDEEEATLILGTVYGKVLRTRGLPYDAFTQRIDNNQLPFGYVSSVDIGENESTILLTFSNYGVESVWLTRNGGETWQNIEYNLPDMPVRWGVFNPEDDRKIMLATEAGVWGIENTDAEDPIWIPYNDGLLATRVDMIELRNNDSTVIAATHGNGMYLGKYDQGEEVALFEASQELTVDIYPNPTTDLLHIKFPTPEIMKLELMDINGRIVLHELFKGSVELDLSEQKTGIYILRFQGEGQAIQTKKILKI